MSAFRTRSVFAFVVAAALTFGGAAVAISAAPDSSTVVAGCCFKG